MMNRRMIAGLLCGLIAAAPITALADSKDDRIAELESEVAALQETVADLKEQLAAGKSTSQDAYNIGEPWVVEGQWKLTVDSVEETDSMPEERWATHTREISRCILRKPLSAQLVRDRCALAWTIQAASKSMWNIMMETMLNKRLLSM